MTARQLHRITPLWPTHGNSQGGTPPWMQDAPCRRNPDLWFSEDPDDVQAAKDACLAECPLKRVIACMDYAFDNQITWGVWGGVSRDERVEKRCCACGELKLLAEFGPNIHRADARNSSCRPCAREIGREGRQRNRAENHGDGRLVQLSKLTEAQDMRSAESEQRIFRYGELMSEPGVTRAEAMRTLGITERTAQRYEARLREQQTEVAA